MDEAKTKFSGLEIFQCDLSDQNQCKELADWIIKTHPKINLLINNAAIVNKTNFLNTKGIIEIAQEEMDTNFMAPVRLINFLYPQLQENNNSAIINITTGLLYSPRTDYPFYNATKSALHSFTQVFRKQTEKTNVEVIEVMFPAVKTLWHQGNPPKIAISAEKAVDMMFTGLEKGKPEIRVAGANLLYKISRIAPNFAFKKVNSLNDEKQ